MMEQGSLADLLTLAKSGDDNKLGEMMAMMNGGMGGQQWMWWILIILFAFGGFGNDMFGRNMAPNGLDNANQLILEKTERHVCRTVWSVRSCRQRYL